jgi:hypothetical protein
LWAKRRSQWERQNSIVAIANRVAVANRVTVANAIVVMVVVGGVSVATVSE